MRARVFRRHAGEKTNAVAAVVADAAATATTVASPGLPDGGVATSGPAVVAPTAVTANIGAPVTGAPVPKEEPTTDGAVAPAPGLPSGGAAGSTDDAVAPVSGLPDGGAERGRGSTGGTGGQRRRHTTRGNTGSTDQKRERSLARRYQLRTRKRNKNKQPSEQLPKQHQ